MPDIIEIDGSFPYLFSVPPIAAWTTIVQRTDSSYLVDAKFNLSKDGSFHKYGSFRYGPPLWGVPIWGVPLYGARKYGPDETVFNANLINADYSTDNGLSWNPCTPQTYDRKHTAENPIEIDGTPEEFDFVWNAFFDLPDDFEGYVIFRFEFTASTSVIITSVPIWISTVEQIESQELIASRFREFKIDDFLGEGPIVPWRRGPSDFMTARGRELIKSSVRIILGTRAATSRWGGELPWDPAFGNLLWTLRHAPGDEISDELAEGYIQFSLELEPRIVFGGAVVRREVRDGSFVMYVDVTYDLITSNVDGNRVILSEPEKLTIEVR